MLDGWRDWRLAAPAGVRKWVMGLDDLRQKYQDKQYFDERKTPADVWAVLRASALLGISEFRLFHIAYRFWYGHEADEDQIERYFVPYMFRDMVPPWVRHFTNRVQTMDRDGTLDPSAFGIRPRQATKADVQRGRLYAMYLVSALAVLYILAELSANALWLQQCYLPPCY
jgi:hypothetical protein